MQPSLRLQLLVPSLQFLGLATAIIGEANFLPFSSDLFWSSHQCLKHTFLVRASQVSKEGEESEYPAYGVTGPAKEVTCLLFSTTKSVINSALFQTISCIHVPYPLFPCSHSILKDNFSPQASPAGDRKLAQSAQMYHYQVSFLFHCIIFIAAVIIFTILMLNPCFNIFSSKKLIFSSLPAPEEPDDRIGQRHKRWSWRQCQCWRGERT